MNGSDLEMLGRRGDTIIDVFANEGEPVEGVTVTGDMSLELRASRLGTGKGRVYTIEVGCSSDGVTSAGVAEVLVPHNQRR